MPFPGTVAGAPDGRASSSNEFSPPLPLLSKLSARSQTSATVTSTSKVVFRVPHVEEGFESTSDSPFVPMIAGAIAGAVEHMCMYPVDTFRLVNLKVKTRLQAIQPGQPKYDGVVRAFASIVHAEGVPRLYRGVSAIVLAALPSHAIYFGTYELGKHMLGANQPGNHHLSYALSGAMAQMAHDAVVTPVDVVKQRLQLYGSTFTGVAEVVHNIIKKEGVSAFYASYSTTLVMNVPFISAHFVAYEFLKSYLTGLYHQNNIHHSPAIHMVAGAGAGALGGLVSNPFDVVKTRIQTDTALPVETRNFSGAFRRIMANEGIRGFTKGLSARVLYFTPSAAICWTTYEAMKKFLGLH